MDSYLREVSSTSIGFWSLLTYVRRLQTKYKRGPKRMARTKQTARKIFEVTCVQCGTRVASKLERYSALEGRLVQSQRCADCRNCPWKCLDHKIKILDENLVAMTKEDRDLTAVRFDFEGFYEINDATKRVIVKKFERVHGKDAWGALGYLSPSLDSDDEDEEDLWLAVQRVKRVRRVNVADHLKLKWMLQTCTKSPINKYKNTAGRAWLSSQQASAASRKR